MSNIKAIISAILGLVVVGGVGTYVVVENMGLQMADLPFSEVVSDEGAAETDIVAPSNVVAEDENAQDDAVVANDADSNRLLEKEPGSDVPTFDLLRVEPDGSTVIAGKGRPNSTMMVLTGDTVLGQTDVGVSGDFVIIFDYPLAPGDHELYLKMVDAAGNITLSQELGIVSIPDSTGEQVLAMVSKPGSASRILTAPEAETVDNGAVDVAVAADIAEQDDVVEAVQKASEEVETAARETAKNADSEITADEEAQPADITGNEASIEAETEIAAVNLDDQPDSDVSSDVALPVEAKVKVEEDIKDASSSLTEEESLTEPQIAAVSPNVRPNVRIEAVEVEGDMLFVAGIGSEGSQVRVFVDDNEAGLSPINPEGRFLLEANMPLSVGQHMVTAALEDSMNNVLLRAIVPFMRPETEAAAAVAAAESSPILPEPTTEEDVAADEITTTEVKPDQEVAQIDSSTDEDLKSDDKAVASLEVDADDAATPLDAYQATSDDIEVASNKVDNTDVSSPATIVQDSLTPAATQSVIIRRGDTLWQIARRTYGQGVRYTTIYLANQDQIKNPNRISPGQVFSVPDEGMDFEEAEGLHLDLSRANR